MLALLGYFCHGVNLFHYFKSIEFFYIDCVESIILCLHFFKDFLHHSYCLVVELELLGFLSEFSGVLLMELVLRLNKSYLGRDIFSSAFNFGSKFYVS